MTLHTRYRFFTILSVAVLLLCIGAAFLLTHLPWLGIKFAPAADGRGVQVIAVSPGSPNAALVAGDVIIALDDGTHHESLSAETLIQGAAWFKHYSDYNHFKSHHQRLWQIVVSGNATFELLDGRRLEVALADPRPLADLPGTVWLLLAVGFTTFLIGCIIYSYQPQAITSQIVFAGAIFFLLAVLCAALVQGRELTLPPAWMAAGIEFNILGIVLFGYSLISLIWHYGVPLGRFPLASVAYGTGVAIFLNEYLQLFEIPDAAYSGHYAFAFAVLGVFSLLKWLRVRENALQRAALQWLLLTITIGSGAITILFFVPIAYGVDSFMPVSATYAMVPVMYLGLLFGVVRFRLFDLERWWLITWLWLAGGLIVIALDMVFLSHLNFSNTLSLALAIIITGWIYLPVRQWLFYRVLRPADGQLHEHFPMLVATLLGDRGSSSYEKLWEKILRTVYEPLEVLRLPASTERATLAEAGLKLHVPSFDGQAVLGLHLRAQGRSLYGPREARLADTLLLLTRRIATLWQEREKAASKERSRIQRDLHDDVASRLLALMHGVSDKKQQNLAQEAFHALRQAIYALDDNGTIMLQDLLLDLQALLREQAQNHQFRVGWSEPPSIPSHPMTTRDHINLRRILMEAISNAARHASASEMAVTVSIQDGELVLEVCNDGTILQTEDWQIGKGINNIRERIGELHGEAHWTIQTEIARSTCCLALKIPLAINAAP